MIFGAILSLIKAIALFVIGLMPTFPNMATWVNTSLTPLLDVILAANYFVNVRVLAGCLVTTIAFANIEFIWSAIMWIIRKIPGVN